MPRGFRLTSPAPARQRENDVERACLDLLRARNWKPVRLPSGLFKTLDGRMQTYGERGIPDYVCVHGIHAAFFMECKRPGCELSPDQKAWFRLHVEVWRLNAVCIDSVETLWNFLATHERARSP